MKIALLVILLTLTGCPGNIKQAPKVIPFPVVTYTPIPAELTADCAVPVLQERTWAGLADFVVQLRGSLQECSTRMQAIRGIQGNPVPTK